MSDHKSIFLISNQGCFNRFTAMPRVQNSQKPVDKLTKFRHIQMLADERDMFADDENDDFIALKPKFRPKNQKHQDWSDTDDEDSSHDDDDLDGKPKQKKHKRQLSLNETSWHDIVPEMTEAAWHDLSWQNGKVPSCSEQETIGFSSLSIGCFNKFVPDDKKLISELDVIVKMAGQLEFDTAIELAESFQIHRRTAPLTAGLNALNELTGKAMRRLHLKGCGKSALEIQAKIDAVQESGSISDQKMIINRLIDTIGAFAWCNEQPWSEDDLFDKHCHMQEFFQLCERTCLRFKKPNVTKELKQAQIQNSLRELIKFDDDFNDV